MTKLSDLFQEGTWSEVGSQVIPALYSMGQARKAKKEYQNYKSEIENFERQELNNPYENLTNPFENVSNPFANLGVAAKAAEMQAEQTDIALANTLDNLRQTGAGGATALAQAALKSKQGISANIQQQEAANQKLAAQGQMKVDMAMAQGASQVQQLQGKGEYIKQAMQEQREVDQLDRLQGQMEQARLQQLISREGGIDALNEIGSSIMGGYTGEEGDLKSAIGGLFNGIDLSGLFGGGTGATGLRKSTERKLLNPKSKYYYNK